MTDKQEYDEAVRILAKVVVEANKGCMEGMKEDGVEIESPESFGTDFETAECVLDGLYIDVALRVMELQIK